MKNQSPPLPSPAPSEENKTRPGPSGPSPSARVVPQHSAHSDAAQHSTAQPRDATHDSYGYGYDGDHHNHRTRGKQTSRAIVQA